MIITAVAVISDIVSLTMIIMISILSMVMIIIVSLLRFN